MYNNNLNILWNQPPNTFTDPNLITWPWREPSANRWTLSWSLMYFAALSFYINSGCYCHQPVSGLISNLLRLMFAAPQWGRGPGRAGLQGTEGVTWVGVDNQAARSGVFGLEAERRWFRFLQISMRIFLLRADSWWQDGDHLICSHRKNMITSDWTWQHRGPVHKDCIAQ